jgi:hypothetical protein
MLTTNPVNPGSRRRETQYPLLVFKLNKNLTVKAFPESSRSEDIEILAVTGFVFHEAFSKLLLIRLAEGCPAPPARYAFASVNNQADGRAL